MKVDYITHSGDDLLVVNAARVSMDKEHVEFDSSDKNLLKYLASHGHFTPFTHPQITMRETVPIFVARQRFKHTVGFTYNEISRRYVDTPPDFYYPEEWRERPEGNIKQGSGGVHKKSDKYGYMYDQYINWSKSLYSLMIKEGVAPEQARMLLPQSMYTSYYVTGSLSAWARAYKLRTNSNAQVEIQVLASEWDKICSKLFPETWEALTWG